MEKLIIPSLLDTDLYKLTMQNAVIKLFPEVDARYEFVNRGGTEFPDGFGKALEQQVYSMAVLKLQDYDADYLARACKFFDRTYIDFLRGYRFNPNEVFISQNGGKLSIIIEGPWYRTILWEVPLMALISELYFEMTNQGYDYTPETVERNANKGRLMYRKKFNVADFGTRRRRSLVNHRRVLQALTVFGHQNFVGTSNVMLAREFGLKPIGTMAHEWIQFHAAAYGFTNANRMALDNWAKVYRGALGIALTDTFTTENFFGNFDMYLSKLFDGVRHDSADPFEFGEKTIEHYKSMGIDPLSKTIVFSDSLTVEKADAINDAFCERIKCSFGIGTSLTNDVGVKPLNMVIKLFAAKLNGRWVDTVKLSDTPGKHTGNKEVIERCKAELGV